MHFWFITGVFQLSISLVSNRTDTYFYFKHINDWINMCLSVFDVVSHIKIQHSGACQHQSQWTSREIGFHLGVVSFSFVISQVSFWKNTSSKRRYFEKQTLVTALIGEVRKIKTWKSWLELNTCIYCSVAPTASIWWFIMKGCMTTGLLSAWGVVRNKMLPDTSALHPLCVQLSSHT